MPYRMIRDGVYPGTGLPLWQVFDADEYDDTSRRPRPIGSVWIVPALAADGHPLPLGGGARWSLAGESAYSEASREAVTDGAGYPGYAANAVRAMVAEYERQFA